MFRLKLPSIGIGLIFLLLLSASLEAAAQTRRKATGAIKVITGHAGSVVFINNVRHGSTGENGELDLPRVQAGSYPVRVRTVGYVDWKGRVTVAPNSSRVLKVEQQPTTDEALLHYQRGDQLRDSGKNADAVQEYKKALELRPRFPEARVGMVRSLIVLQDFQEAEKQIQAALKEHRGPYPEAQTVLANMRRNQGLVEESIVEYRKALRLARGVSPEAHIGLGIALEEMNRIDEAIKEYRTGIAQDMDTEPILYYLLGSALEKRERYKEAIDAYGNYLRLDPEGQYASAVESIIERLKEEIDR
ncbi:MAG TPA: tetratricopeptide repeat protein [Blastocatellia bacterium]|nr:tetratricopeptide repeat protein [Blastocatellia bacterium]